MRQWVPLLPEQLEAARRLIKWAEDEPFLFALQAAIWFVTGRMSKTPIWLHDEIIYEVIKGDEDE